MFEVSSREFVFWTSTWLRSQQCVEVPNDTQTVSHQVSTSSCLVLRLACASKSTQHVSPCSAEQEQNLNCVVDTTLERCQTDPIPRRSRFLESHAGSLLLVPFPAFAAWTWLCCRQLESYKWLREMRETSIVWKNQRSWFRSSECQGPGHGCEHISLRSSGHD